MLQLKILRGARAGASMEIPPRTPIRLGRHPDSDVQFDATTDLQVSTHHAEIRVEEGGMFLYDMGSSNGTFVRGQRITRHLLVSGDEICFGEDGPAVLVTLQGATPVPKTIAAMAPAAAAPMAATPAAAPVPAATPTPAPAPAAAPVQVVPTAPGPAQPAPAPAQAPVASAPRPVARPPGPPRKPLQIWLLFVFIGGSLGLAIGAKYLGEYLRSGGSLDSVLSGGGGTAADPDEVARARKQDLERLKKNNLLLSSTPAPTRQVLDAQPVKRRVGRVMLRSGRRLGAVTRRARIQARPIRQADSVARQALQDADETGAYVLGETVVNIEAPGGTELLGGWLFITLPLTREQLAAASEAWAGALYLSEVGPQFILGLVDADAGTVTIATRHLSQYSPAAANPKKKKEGWGDWFSRRKKEGWDWAQRKKKEGTDWAKRKKEQYDTFQGKWKPKCEEPLVWSRKPGLKPSSKELKPNGCSAPDAKKAWNRTTIAKYKKFHHKDNPSGTCSFKRACDEHDRCWTVCGKAKSKCDAHFQYSLIRQGRTCLYRLKQQGVEGDDLKFKRKQIQFWISWYAYMPTVRLANSKYKAAQIGACECLATMAGTWDLDRDALMASAGAVARYMARARGGSAEKYESRMRDAMSRMELTMVLEESGRFTFRGKNPNGRRIRTTGKWRQHGNTVVLSKLRGSPLPSRGFRIINGNLQMSAPGMGGQVWIFKLRGGPK